MTMPKAIANVTLRDPTTKAVVAQESKMSSTGPTDRGLQVTVKVWVRRTDKSKDKQDLKGTYKFVPNPHENSKYNNGGQKDFYRKAAFAAQESATTSPAYALVAIEHLQFKFGSETYRAVRWDGPIDVANYMNQWQVDGPAVPV